MPFEKGKSGNPGGRPKENNEVKELCREHTTEAIERLVHWMRDDDSRVSLNASQALLDRGYGKPAQSIDTTISNPDGTNLESSSNIEIARKIAYVLDEAVKSKQSDDPALH